MKKKSTQREVGEFILAFVAAWIIYQGLALATGTPLPVVSIVSDSMYHGPSSMGTMCGQRLDSPQTMGEFWQKCSGDYLQYNITKEQFRSFISPSGMSRGDLLLVVRDDNPKIGNVLIYQRAGSSFTIVHRLVAIGSDYYIVKGDNNKDADMPVPKNAVIGRVVLAVPVLGYPRLMLHMVGI